MTPVAGTLRTPDGTYHPSGARAKLDGRLTAHMLPGEPSHIQLSNVRGEVQATDLHFQPAPFASIQHAAWLPWAALAVVATAGTSIGAVLWRTVLRTRPANVEEILNNTALCAQARMYDRALSWARQGRALAPGNVRFAAHEAECLAAKGNVEGAVAAYANAHRLAVHGEFALEAARLLRNHGWSSESVEDWLKASIEKSPEGLDAIEQEFPEIVSRSSWHSASKIARLHSR